jgi:hypothetical protein
MPDATIKAAVEKYITALQIKVNEYFAGRFKMLTPPVIDVQFGQKYAKVIKVETHSRSVHSFVALVDIATKEITAKAGDILMSASWKAPAPHARGSVLNSDPLVGVGVYGADYLR